MRKRRSGKSTASLAGWLFADLTLVLFVVSLSSAESNAACPEPRKGTVIPEWCPPTSTSPSTTTTSTTSTTTTTVPDTTVPDGDGSEPGGIKPEPVEIVLTSWRSSSLAVAIERELRDAYRGNAALQSVGKIDEIRFGVIIVYGGSKGEQNNFGDRLAERAEEILSESWIRVEPTTYFETGHDQGLVAGGLNLKLFPVLG
jgi:hypothetical protein